jgi:hypothetical protein
MCAAIPLSVPAALSHPAAHTPCTPQPTAARLAGLGAVEPGHAQCRRASARGTAAPRPPRQVAVLTVAALTIVAAVTAPLSHTRHGREAPEHRIGGVATRKLSSEYHAPGYSNSALSAPSGVLRQDLEISQNLPRTGKSGRVGAVCIALAPFHFWGYVPERAGEGEREREWGRARARRADAQQRDREEAHQAGRGPRLPSPSPCKIWACMQLRGASRRSRALRAA